MSQSKTPELLQKGIIRSKHNVFVYKDGTLRIDVTNAPLTHFRPSDVGSDIKKLMISAIRRTSPGSRLATSPSCSS